MPVRPTGPLSSTSRLVRFFLRFSVCVTSLLSLMRSPALAGDWPQWRGLDGGGVSSEAGLPERWNETDNIRWKVDLPGRGLSSPIVVQGRLYVTACSGALQDRLHVLCFDAATG